MNKIKQLFAATLIMVGLIAAPIAIAAPAFAEVNPQKEACEGTGGTWSGTACTGNSNQANLPSLIKTLVNVLLYIIGAVAVLVIIVGAFRYTTSAGDASKVKAAKDTILYAVVGLVVAILAYAIVNFVVSNV